MPCICRTAYQSRASGSSWQRSSARGSSSSTIRRSPTAQRYAACTSASTCRSLSKAVQLKTCKHMSPGPQSWPWRHAGHCIGCRAAEPQVQVTEFKERASGKGKDYIQVIWAKRTLHLQAQMLLPYSVLTGTHICLRIRISITFSSRSHPAVTCWRLSPMSRGPSGIMLANLHCGAAISNTVVLSDVLQVFVMVEQDSQRPILLGRQGSQLKKLSTDSRRAIEEFLGQCRSDVKTSILSQPLYCRIISVSGRWYRAVRIHYGILSCCMQAGKCTSTSRLRSRQSGGETRLCSSSMATDTSGCGLCALNPFS